MPYKLDPTATIEGTSGVDVGALLSPALLVRRFGQPIRGIERKVSGHYVFTDAATGNVFTLYDWKSTSLWERGLPDPDDFWADMKPKVFNIGANDEGEEQAEDFVRWLEQSVALEIH